MSASIDLTVTGATDIVHIDAGIPKPVTTGAADTFVCSAVQIDANGGVLGTIDATHTTPSGYAEGDQIAFPSASPPTIAIS